MKIFSALLSAKAVIVFALIFTACQEPTSQVQDKAISTAAKAETIRANTDKTTKMDTLYPKLATNPAPDYLPTIDLLKQALQQKQPLKLICYGNSITRGYKIGTYEAVQAPYPQVLQEALTTHFHYKNIAIINEGHNGWRIDQALQQLPNLVVKQEPQWVLLEFGINDAYMGFSSTQFEQYLIQVVSQLQTQKIAVILLSPTPILTPQHAKVLSYIPVMHKVAIQKNVNFINIHHKLVERIYQSGIKLQEILPDGVHFADKYYAWIAEAVLPSLIAKP